MNYLDHYRSDPRVINFFSMASSCLVHGEMLVTALGTLYSTRDDIDHYRPGYTDNVNMAMRILTEAVEIGLLIRGDFKPSNQQRFFGIDGQFGKQVKPPSSDGEMFSRSILYQYRGDKVKIYDYFGWSLGPVMPPRYRPVITTREVNPDIEGSGWYLLIDGVIVDCSWKEIDLFDDDSEARLDDPRRAYGWRESARILNAIVRKPSRERHNLWCEMGAHEMKSVGEAYCYTFRDLIVCRECMEKHNEIYFVYDRSTE